MSDADEKLPTDPECDLPDARRALYLSRIDHTAYTRSAVTLAEHGVPIPQDWPMGYGENVHIMLHISERLDAAGYRMHRGGGFEESDAVAELLAMRDRMGKIASMHRKDVAAGGMTSGYCSECNWLWPCPTYDWARETSDRDPLLGPWDRSDDDD